jgi:hypothetical protein
MVRAVVRFFKKQMGAAFFSWRLFVFNQHAIEARVGRQQSPSAKTTTNPLIQESEASEEADGDVRSMFWLNVLKYLVGLT